MRKGFLATLLLAGLLALFAAPPAYAAVSVTVSVSAFHDTLAPYGRWAVTSRYGEVWIPSGIAAGWEPYWDGEWIWTDYGWTWVSFDPWGDIPCHYGTWVWVDPYGWVWEPGTVWAPAWVTWAWTDDFIGWAPVPPTLDISFSGYSGPAVVVAASRYVFVPSSQFVGVNVQTARVAPTQNTVLLSRSRKATRFAVSGGIVRTTADPPLSFVQKASHKSIQRVGIDRLKARPTTLAAAHVSGKRIGVVAPARERQAAMTHANKQTGKVPAAPAPAKSTARANKTLEAHGNKSRPESAHVATAKPSGSEKTHGRVAQSDHGKRMPQQAAKARPAQPAPETRHEAHRQGARLTSPSSSERPTHAARGSESSRPPQRAASSSHEEKRIAMRSHPAAPAPASAAPREPSRETAHPAPPPQAHGNPPPAARAERPQPPPQAPAPKEKEKDKGHD